MTPLDTQLQAGERLLQWLQAVGGTVHPALELKLDPLTGLSAYSNSPIAANSTLISIPVNQVISPDTCIEALKSSLRPLPTNAASESPLNPFPDWPKRTLLAAYICAHHLPSASQPPGAIHTAYVASLPKPGELRTPLWWSDSERGLLEGTNLWGAVLDREREWKAEWAQLQRTLAGFDELDWEHYLAACTYVSSRAFPSRLLSLQPNNDVPSGVGISTTAAQEEETLSHPILLPGLDMLNHKRNQPITWLTSPTTSSSTSSSASQPPDRLGTDDLSISFVTPVALPGSQQVFNNYGPKSNEEFLLGYGFTLPSNPDDMVVLRLGKGMGQALSEKKRGKLKAEELDVEERWELKWDGEVPAGLLRVLRIVLAPEPTEPSALNGHQHHAGDGHGEESIDEDDDDDEESHHHHQQAEKELQLEMEVLEALGGMLDEKLAKLASASSDDRATGEEVKGDVHAMATEYKQGQVDILEKALDKLSERIERIEGLLEEGVDCPCCM